jgi:hypothetical protein
MGGGLIQLVAYGSQDIYLTGNPQITFFKLVYRRHTNFSMESIKQTIDGSNTITSEGGGQGSVTIDRNGDLLSKIYVVTKGANIDKGANIIKEVKLEIGGQTIDTHSRNWLNNLHALTIPADKLQCFKRMIGHNDNGSSYVHKDRNTNFKTIAISQIPLEFWFCKNPGLALPLIALQYHEIILHFVWGGGAELSNDEIFKSFDTINYDNETATCELWCDYIYLDTDERRRFAQTSHEYLIEQVQEMSVTSGTTSSANGSQLKIDLNLNHPVKELIWDYEGRLFSDITLELNGHERFAKQSEEYFTLRQPYEYHTRVPNNNLLLTAHRHDHDTTRHEVAGFDLIYKGVSRSIVSESGSVSGTSAFQLRWATTEGRTIPLRFNTTMSTVMPVTTFSNNLAAGEIPSSSSGSVYLLLNKYISIINLIHAGDTLIFTESGSTTGSHSGSASFQLTVQGQRIRYVDSGRDRAASGMNESDDGVNTAVITCMALPGQAQNDAGTASQQHIQTPADGKQYTLTSITTSGEHPLSHLETLNIDIESDGKIEKRIGVYSFALKPEEHQPSGTCNFSRIDTAKLIGNYNPSNKEVGDTINIYAVNYNVLRIMSGMGGLAYSN